MSDCFLFKFGSNFCYFCVHHHSLWPSFFQSGENFFKDHDVHPHSSIISDCCILFFSCLANLKLSQVNIEPLYACFNFLGIWFNHFHLWFELLDGDLASIKIILIIIMIIIILWGHLGASGYLHSLWALPKRKKKVRKRSEKQIGKVKSFEKKKS